MTAREDRDALPGAKRLIDDPKLVDSHSKCDTGYVRSHHGNRIQPPQP
jgi:hypothetical protein